MGIVGIGCWGREGEVQGHTIVEPFSVCAKNSLQKCVLSIPCLRVYPH